MTDTSTRLKLQVTAGTILLAGVLIALAAVFANAYGARRAGDNAAALHRAEAVLGTSAVARAQVGQAVLVTNYSQIDEDAGPQAAVAATEATAALDSLDERMDDLAAVVDAAAIQPAYAAFTAAAREAMAEVQAGDIEAAAAQAGAPLDDGYTQLVDAVTAERDSQVASLATAQTVVGRVSEVSRFLVAFFVPVAAILLYRRMLKRQQEQIRLEARLRSERELSKAKDEFVANVSHELRTPLTSIYGFSQILADAGAEDPDTVKELVGLITSEAGELSRMVEDLLTAARADADALSYHLELFDSAKEMAEALAPMLRAGAPVALDVPSALIHADRFRFRQVVRNLVSNSLKYGQQPIGVRGVRMGDSVTLTVYDHGPGVPEELEKRLFQRFLHRGRQPLLVGSVGLGLSIVRLLAEGMGGEVGYERVGEETRFSVTFPVAAESVESAPAVA